jgi:hypothetical protein
MMCCGNPGYSFCKYKKIKNSPFLVVDILILVAYFTFDKHVSYFNITLWIGEAMGKKTLSHMGKNQTHLSTQPQILHWCHGRGVPYAHCPEAAIAAFSSMCTLPGSLFSVLRGWLQPMAIHSSTQSCVLFSSLVPQRDSLWGLEHQEHSCLLNRTRQWTLLWWEEAQRWLSDLG